MKGKIFFDMDGTIADLYNTKGWLDAFHKEEPIFDEIAPMVDMKELKTLCEELQAKEIEIGIITWLPMDARAKYEKRCEEDKKIWIRKHMPYINEFHALKYGTPKTVVVERKEDEIVILIDDNNEVIEEWNQHENHVGLKVENGNTIKKIKEMLGIK